MANTLSTQGRTVAPWRGRPVVTLNEHDGRDHYFHGIAIGPEGMSIAEALAAIDAAFVKVYSEDFTYDEVWEALHATGFECILAAEWREHLVDLQENTDGT